MTEPRSSSSSDRRPDLRRLLAEWSMLRVESIAQKLNVSHAAAERLCRDVGAVTARRSGVDWAYGRSPRRALSDSAR